MYKEKCFKKVRHSCHLKNLSFVYVDIQIHFRKCFEIERTSVRSIVTLLYNSTSFLYIPEYKLIHIDQVSLAPPSLLSILPSLYPNFCETSCFEFHLHVQHFSVCLCVQALCSDRISIPVHTIAWLRCFSLQHSIMYTHALFSFFFYLSYI